MKFYGGPFHGALYNFLENEITFLFDKIQYSHVFPVTLGSL